MPANAPTEPWYGFFKHLDSLLDHEVTLVCFGGFVVTQHYGLSRLTGDVDCLEAIPMGDLDYITEHAGLGSPLHNEHGVYLEYVGISNLPDSYNERLRPMLRGVYKHVRLMAVDPYDLALSKLERNREVDRGDVEYLIQTLSLERQVFEQRYYEEMRPYLGRPEREDLTLRLWIEEFFSEAG